ncbi:hypothetical protein NFI96_003115 [Prochilodus magdalenae]|nr:hypothetical protein NFI96_003115 [Prochilodus magdalenae]
MLRHPPPFLSRFPPFYPSIQHWMCLHVDVGVVHFTPLAQPQIQQPFKLVEKLVRNVFQFRGKHCYKGLEMLFPEAVRPKLAEELLRSADVDPTLRPVQLSMAHFRSLADAYSRLCRENQELISYDFRDELRRKHQSRSRSSKSKDPHTRHPIKEEKC